jgi:hypothetical protein
MATSKPQAHRFPAYIANVRAVDCCVHPVPSGTRASTSGSASSTRRPSGARMRSIAWRGSASEPDQSYRGSGGLAVAQVAADVMEGSVIATEDEPAQFAGLTDRRPTGGAASHWLRAGA